MSQPYNKYWRPGLVCLEHGNQYWTAAIDSPTHGAQIECYGRTAEAATALRDRILALLSENEPGSVQIYPASALKGIE